MFDAGLFHKNYNADTGSCGSIGEPSARVQREWKGVDEGFHESAWRSSRRAARETRYTRRWSRESSRAFPSSTPRSQAIRSAWKRREFPFILGPESKHAGPFYPDDFRNSPSRRFGDQHRGAHRHLRPGRLPDRILRRREGKRLGDAHSPGQEFSGHRRVIRMRGNKVLRP